MPVIGPDDAETQIQAYNASQPRLRAILSALKRIGGFLAFWRWNLANIAQAEAGRDMPAETLRDSGMENIGDKHL